MIAMLNDSNTYSHFSDNALFNLLKDDDQKAFAEIYQRYAGFLVNAAQKHLQCLQKSEDIVQEIFVSFYNRRHSIDITVSLRAYLWQALKFKILNEFRFQDVRNTYQRTFIYTYTHSYKNECHHHFESKEIVNSIYQFINELPEKCKEVFLLSRDYDLSYRDISLQLGISVSTVEKHISKALKILRYNLSAM